uniref:NR LBD domain-containing protein n=1 Tax=Macrostomum lignano TaxID=282301 RepID=A0A1I8FMA0_9PLAT
MTSSDACISSNSGCDSASSELLAILDLPDDNSLISSASAPASPLPHHLPQTQQPQQQQLNTDSAATRAVEICAVSAVTPPAGFTTVCPPVRAARASSAAWWSPGTPGRPAATRRRTGDLAGHPQRLPVVPPEEVLRGQYGPTPLQAWRRSKRCDSAAATAKSTGRIEAAGIGDQQLLAYLVQARHDFETIPAAAPGRPSGRPPDHRDAGCLPATQLVLSTVDEFSAAWEADFNLAAAGNGGFSAAAASATAALTDDASLLLRCHWRCRPLPRLSAADHQTIVSQLPEPQWYQEPEILASLAAITPRLLSRVLAFSTCIFGGSSACAEALTLADKRRAADSSQSARHRYALLRLASQEIRRLRTRSVRLLPAVKGLSAVFEPPLLRNLFLGLLNNVSAEWDALRITEAELAFMSALCLTSP